MMTFRYAVLAYAVGQFLVIATRQFSPPAAEMSPTAVGQVFSERQAPRASGRILICFDDDQFAGSNLKVRRLQWRQDAAAAARETR